jgi:hypothetical protein
MPGFSHIASSFFPALPVLPQLFPQTFPFLNPMKRIHNSIIG